MFFDKVHAPFLIPGLMLLAAIATVCLGVAGCSAIRRYEEKRRILLGVLPDQPPPKKK